MRQYVPDPATSDSVPIEGTKVASLPFAFGERTVMSHKGDMLTGFVKPADYEETYRVNFSPFLPDGLILTEVVAWTPAPAFIVSVIFDDTKADVTVWGGDGGARYVVSVAFAAGIVCENRVEFIVKPYGLFTFFGSSTYDFPPLEAAFDNAINMLLPGYDFSPWSS